MKCRFHPISFVDFLTYQEWSTGEPQAPVVHVGPSRSRMGACIGSLGRVVNAGPAFGPFIFGGQGVGMVEILYGHAWPMWANEPSKSPGYRVDVLLFLWMFFFGWWGLSNDGFWLLAVWEWLRCSQLQHLRSTHHPQPTGFTWTLGLGV